MKASLGLTQLALLERLRPRAASAATGSPPTRLVTIFMQGGWMPLYGFCPLSAGEIGRLIPAPGMHKREPLFFNASQVTNLDGSGDGQQDGYAKLRMPKLWNEQALSSGQLDPRQGTSPHGWSWVQNRLWENTTVVHGVDQGTAAHDAGMVSALCGIPAPDFRSPGIHAWVANALYARYADSRPLPSVAIGDVRASDAVTLRPEAGPIITRTFEDLEYRMSDRTDNAWAGLRNFQEKPQLDFSGAAAGRFRTNPLEDRLLRRIRKLKGTLTRESDAVYEKLYNGYAGVSKVLASDVVARLKNVQGAAHTTPFWTPENKPFSVGMGGNGNDSGSNWENDFTLALKLLKGDVTSAVAVNMLGPRDFAWDNHGDGHPNQFIAVRAAIDVIGRFIGELKSTPLSTGRTLLDDTLVMVIGDFGRTWPHSGDGTGHWPYTSVIFAGGGVAPNRMIGNYETANEPTFAQGFPGSKVALRDGSSSINRVPRSADIVQTALRVMGIDNATIPGGSGEIIGVKA